MSEWCSGAGEDMCSIVWRLVTGEGMFCFDTPAGAGGRWGTPGILKLY